MQSHMGLRKHMLFPSYNCRRLEEGSVLAAAGVQDARYVQSVPSAELRLTPRVCFLWPPPPKLLELFLSVFLNAELPCRLDNHFGSCPQTPHRVFQPRAPLKYRLDSVYLLLLFIYFLSGLPLFCGADKSQGNRVRGRQTRS